MPKGTFALAGLTMFVFPLAAWLLVDSWRPTTDSESGLAGSPSPSIARRPLGMPIAERRGDLRLYHFEAPVGESMIYDIVAAESVVWLGTGQGLIRFEADQPAIGYRAFAGAPSEWARRLALRQDLLAVDIMVAPGPTGAKHAGSHLFDSRSETWMRLGGNVADQVWLGGDLWQRTWARKLVRWTWSRDRWVDQHVPLQADQCSEASLAAIDGALWMAQQGTARSGLRYARTARALPCGLLRYEPASRRESFYDEDDGMPSGFGRDVDGDASQVYVAHSIRHDRVSWLDTRTGEWHSLKAVGTGNRMAVSESAVWLATPSAKHPLVRIDRQTERRTDIPDIPPDFYVSAIDVQGDSIWIGLYRKHWQGETYTVESLVGRLED